MARRGQTFRLLWEPFSLRLGLPCNLLIRCKGDRSNLGGAIVSPSEGTVRDARPGSTATVLPPAGSLGRSTSTTKLATERPAVSFTMVTLLGPAGSSRLQVMGMGMASTLVSLRVCP